MTDRAYRFELLTLELAEDENNRIARELEDFKKEIVAKQSGRCECGNERARWVRDEFYCCYDCLMEGLSCEACEGSYPSRRVEELEDYMSEDVWDEEWGIENGVIPF